MESNNQPSTSNHTEEAPKSSAGEEAEVIVITDSQEGPIEPGTKKRKIHMNDQECLLHSQTKDGALALTNPTLVLKSNKDVNSRLYPHHNGRKSSASNFGKPPSSVNAKPSSNNYSQPTFRSDGKTGRTYGGPSRNKFPPRLSGKQSTLDKFFTSPKRAKSSSKSFSDQSGGTCISNGETVFTGRKFTLKKMSLMHFSRDEKSPNKGEEEPVKTEKISLATGGPGPLATEVCMQTKESPSSRRKSSSSSSQQYYENSILMDKVVDDGVEILKVEKPNTFGLIGDGTEEEDEKINHFENLPLELMENIFCQLPMLDLCLSCVLVCKHWNDVISHDQFILWKKTYCRFKAEEAATVEEIKDIIKSNEMKKKGSCLLYFIRYMSTFKRRPGQSAAKDLERHSKYELAREVIQENAPELITHGKPDPWSTVAALTILAHSVEDIQDIIKCLLHPKATCTATSVTEGLYCMATILLALQRRYGLSRGPHFRVYYALYLYENKPGESYEQLEETANKSKRGQQSLYKYGHRTGGVQLTHEQMRIINYDINRNPGEIIKIIAFAGTGKTTTLVRFAQMRPHMRFLYVAFNKAVKDQAIHFFPFNVECRTSHSLAYKGVGYRYRGKMTFNLKPYFVPKLLSERRDRTLHWMVHSKLVVATLESFTCSKDDFITTAHVPEATDGGARLRHSCRMIILADAEMLWNRMKDTDDREARITHDVYMKLYQLSRPTIQDMDCILIDEAQDLTLAQQDVLFRQPCTKILVGDPHQQIYAFRGARNAMQEVQANKIFHLTQSFRFGPEVAYVANCVLDVLKGVRKQTIVGKEEPGGILGDQVGQLAVICRTNSRLFSEAAKLCQEENIRLGFASGMSGYGFDRLVELSQMYNGTPPSQLKDKFFQRFASFTALDTYAQKAHDVELLNLITIVKIYHIQIPTIVEKIKQKSVKDYKNATVVLSTAHKAKGLEFDTVKLSEDYIQQVERIVVNGNEFHVTPNELPVPEDEKNLLYVALTRAKKRLIMNGPICQILIQAWEEFKLPVSSKRVLSLENNDLHCNECGEPMKGPQRALVLEVKEIKLAGYTRHGAYLCSKCSRGELGGYASFFGGEIEDAEKEDLQYK